MTDEQEMELHEELKWAKIEAEQAHMMVAALQARLVEEEAANEALEAKLKSESNCACSYDGVDDICMCHSPKLAAAEVKNQHLLAALYEIAALRADPEFGLPPLQTAQEIARKALELHDEV